MRFRRAHRLRSSLDFARLRQRSRHVGGRYLSLNYSQQPRTTGDASDARGTRVGFTVSKRVGNAVTRNRVRRRLREAVRYQLTRLPPEWDIVVIARPAAAEAPYAALEADVREVFTRAGLWQNDLDIEQGMP
jgi:ribonuclease P protein component